MNIKLFAVLGILYVIGLEAGTITLFNKSGKIVYFASNRDGKFTYEGIISGQKSRNRKKDHTAKFSFVSPDGKTAFYGEAPKGKNLDITLNGPSYKDVKAESTDPSKVKFYSYQLR